MAIKNTKRTRKSAKALGIATLRPKASTRHKVSAAMTREVRERWETWRADHILSIMQTDGIEYARAVKRSRRRLINAGDWQ